MHAGVPEQGAEQAWWQLSLGVENWRSQQTQATGGATDIYKCFDQIARPLIHTTARVAGISQESTYSVRQHHGSNSDTKLTHRWLWSAAHTPMRNTTGMPFLDDFHRSDGQTLDIQVQKEERYQECLLTTFTSLSGWKETLRELSGSHQRHPHLHHHRWRNGRSKQELRVLD